jgi:benzoyl-CoA reductase subunit C
MALEAILRRCEELLRDNTFAAVREYQERTGRRAVGFLPVYAPREIVHAAGALPVGIMGGGEDLEIIKGDAFFQSYICHLPRSTVELLVGGQLDFLDGMLFPSTCDVIRNLSGMWRMLRPATYVRYLDVPQNFDPEVGGEFYRRELRGLWEELCQLCGTVVDEARLRASIALYNENRALHGELLRRRCESPSDHPASDCYLVVRAGNVLAVDEHNELLRSYLAAAGAERRPRRDTCRVLLTGSFCEQPPLGFIKTLERAGCSIVADDFVLVSRWITADVSQDGDPVAALADAFLRHSVTTAVRYEPSGRRGEALVAEVARSRAEGVVFAAASFCDPALLERPMLTTALKEAGIPHMACKFSENSGQFQTVREQAGTFADSIRLWGGEA